MRPDFGYYTLATDSCALRILEIFVGIIVACMPSAAHTYRMAAPHFESLRSRLLSSRTFSRFSPFSFLSSRRSRSSRKKESPSDQSYLTDPSSFSDDSLRKEKMQQGEGKMAFATQLARGDLEHMDVCESFVGVRDVRIPNATLVRSCLRSCDRLNGRDLEAGDGGFFDARDWRRATLLRLERETDGAGTRDEGDPEQGVLRGEERKKQEPVLPSHMIGR